MKNCLLLIIVFFSLVNQSYGQNIEVVFKDQSAIKMKLATKIIDIQTKYGKLAIPIEDIRKIEFGFHIPEEDKLEITKLINQLGSKDFKIRDSSSKELIDFNYFSYSLIKDYKSKDRETQIRLEDCLNKIIENNKDIVKIKDYDIVYTKDHPFHGRILNASFEANSEHFGKSELKLSKLKVIQFKYVSPMVLINYDVDKHQDNWFDTGLTIFDSQRLIIEANGNIDLSAITPGQYVCDPDGFTHTGKGGRYPAGRLIAKVGNDDFSVGRNYEGTGREGKLYISVVGNVWGTASAGIVNLRIQVKE